MHYDIGDDDDDDDDDGDDGDDLMNITLPQTSHHIPPQRHGA